MERRRAGDGALWASNLPPWLYARRFQRERVFVEAHGCRIRDASGRWYLDARSSLWDATLGQGHPRIVQALREQLERLAICQTIRHDRPSEVAVRFAEAIVARMPEGLGHVRFGSTGSQMVDAAVMLSRAARSLAGSASRKVVIALQDGYHGTGGGPSALTEPEVLRHQLGPLIPDVHQVACRQPGRWTQALMEAADGVGPTRVTAIVVEPVLGCEVQAIAPADMVELSRYCARTGIHLVVDEVVTGWGRTATWTLSGDLGLRPDLLVLGKGLTGGYVPGAALVVSDRLFGCFGDPVQGAAFHHGSTADGHPLAMAAGLAVIEVLESGVLARVGEIGAHLRARLQTVGRPHLAEVRGRGLLLGAVFRDGAGTPWSARSMDRLRVALERRGVLAHPVGACLTVVPALTIGPDECDELAAALDLAVADVS
jgi:adenosylmethionine-8-amino-7-oxononanoate aminotransferase